MYVTAIGGASGVLCAGLKIIQQDIFRVGNSPHVRSVALYAAVVGGLFLLYGLLLFLCAAGRLNSRPTRLVAIVFPVSFNMLFLFGPPVLSTDVLSYIAHGYIGASLDKNPHVVSETAVAATPIAGELRAYRWGPANRSSPYGPLWTAVEIGVAQLRTNVATQVFAFKFLGMMASLISAVLIWSILSHAVPRQRTLGTLAFLWNPLFIVEFAGEGHNDAFMILLVLLGLALAQRGRPVAAVLSLWSSVLMKYLPLLFLPIVITWLWRDHVGSERDTRRVVLWSIAGCLGMTMIAYAPFWEGLTTFDGTRLAALPDVTGSTPTVLLEVVTRITGVSPAWAEIRVIFPAIVGFVVAWRAWSATHFRSLLIGLAIISVVYLFVASPGYWPWYATLPVAMLVLLPYSVPLAIAASLSFGARLAAPLDLLYDHGTISRPLFFALTWVFGIGLPAVVATASVIYSLRCKPMTQS